MILATFLWIDFWSAAAALATVLLGVATWRMARATKEMLSRADEEITFAQTQVSYSAKQLQVSQRNEVASRQPILIPTLIPGKNRDRRFLNTETGGRVLVQRPEFASFIASVGDIPYIWYCMSFRNVGPGVAILSDRFDCPTLTSTLHHVDHLIGQPESTVLAHDDNVDIVFFIPTSNTSPNSTSNSSWGPTETKIQLRVPYTDLTGNVSFCSEIWYEVTESQFLRPTSTYYESSLDDIDASTVNDAVG